MGPAVAAIVLLSEPVFAAMFAYVLLGELMTLVQAKGLPDNPRHAANVLEKGNSALVGAAFSTEL